MSEALSLVSRNIRKGSFFPATMLQKLECCLLRRTVEESNEDPITVVLRAQCPSSAVTDHGASPLVALCPQSFACGSSFSALSDRLHV